MKRDFSIAANTCIVVLMSLLMLSAMESCKALAELEKTTEVIVTRLILIALMIISVGDNNSRGVCACQLQ